MSVEELTAQLEALRIERDTQVAERDASIVGLVDAVHTYERTTEALRAQVDELTKQLAEKDKMLCEYKDALIEQLRKLLK